MFFMFLRCSAKNHRFDLGFCLWAWARLRSLVHVIGPRLQVLGQARKPNPYDWAMPFKA